MRQTSPSERARLTCLALGLLALGIALAVALGPLEGLPHVSDELAYTLQSRLFAAGMRTGPPPEAASMVLYPFWETSPRSYAVFPLGWPLLLAAFEAVDLAALANPLAGFVLVTQVYALGRRLAGPGVAVVAATTIAVSPAVWMLTASRMAHSWVAVALCAALLVVLDRPRSTARWALVGLAVGYVVLARPFDAALLGGPLLLVGLLRAPAAGRIALLAAPALATALTFYDNAALTGSPTTFPVGPWFEAWADRPGCNALGFGPDRGCHPTLGSWGHTPAKAAELTLQGLRLLDRHLLGVPGGLVVAAAGLVTLGRTGARIAAAFALALAGYALYWSPGHVYGARYYAPLVPLLALGAAAGLHRVAGRVAWLLPVAAAAVGAPKVVDELASGLFCVDAGLSEELRARGIDSGFVMLNAQGQRPEAWPRVGIDAFACDPLLESGDGMVLLDPTGRGEGVQPRHALTTQRDRAAWLAAVQPEGEVWYVDHDVSNDQRTWWQVAPDGRLVPPGGQSLPDILFFTVDTLRADHLGLYGYERATSPWLDEVAADGVVFERALSTSSWTPPASASLITGLSPHQHGIDNGAEVLADDVRQPVLPPQHETLAERLSELGYATFGVSTNLHLGPEQGFAQGFDRYLHLGMMDDAGKALAAAEQLLAELPADRPWFLWVHLLDPHDPYWIASPWAERFDDDLVDSWPDVEATRRERFVRLHPQYAKHLDAQAAIAAGTLDLATLVALYDSEIRLVDETMRTIADKAGLDDDTLLLVTSDHGEEFRDHGRIGHKTSLFQELLHVPWIVRWPARIPAARLQQAVSTVDLTPTVLDLVGGEVPTWPEVTGRSLAPALRAGAEPAAAVLFAQAKQRGITERAVVRWPWKLVVDATHDTSSLYDMAADADERQDVAAANPAVVDELRAAWEAFEAEAPVIPPHTTEQAMTDEQIAELEALGYVE